MGRYSICGIAMNAEYVRVCVGDGGGVVGEGEEKGEMGKKKEVDEGKGVIIVSGIQLWRDGIPLFRENDALEDGGWREKKRKEEEGGKERRGGKSILCRFWFVCFWMVFVLSFLLDI